MTANLRVYLQLTRLMTSMINDDVSVYAHQETSQHWHQNAECLQECLIPCIHPTAIEMQIVRPTSVP